MSTTLGVSRLSTSQRLADKKTLSAILSRVRVDPAAGLNPHPETSDSDSFYVVSYLQGNSHTFTVLFHMILLYKPKPPGKPLALLAMSVLDESASPPLYFRREFLSEIDPKKIAVATTGLDIRMLFDDPSHTSGYLSGTMDELTVEGHSTDNPGDQVLDIELKLKAEGPTFHYLGEGIIPLASGKNYEYAFPSMTTNGTLMLNGIKYDVTGSSWFDREWGDFDFVTWTWMSIELSNGVRMGIWDQQPYGATLPSHVDGEAFATILDPNDALILTRVKIKETSTWTSPDSKRRFPYSWNVCIPGRVTLKVETVLAGQEILSRGIPRIEAKCSVEGEYEGSPVTSVRTFVEVGDILPPSA